jgi:hypothetical protein
MIDTSPDSAQIQDEYIETAGNTRPASVLLRELVAHLRGKAPADGRRLCLDAVVDVGTCLSLVDTVSYLTVRVKFVVCANAPEVAVTAMV